VPVFQSTNWRLNPRKRLMCLCFSPQNGDWTQECL
jgi:hypothetical protein